MPFLDSPLTFSCTLSFSFTFRRLPSSLLFSFCTFPFLFLFLLPFRPFLHSLAPPLLVRTFLLSHFFLFHPSYISNNSLSSSLQFLHLHELVLKHLCAFLSPQPFLSISTLFQSCELLHPHPVNFCA